MKIPSSRLAAPGSPRMGNPTQSRTFSARAPSSPRAFSARIKPFAQALPRLRGIARSGTRNKITTNMAACSVLKRSVLDVDGKSFDVVLSHTSLSWGHVGIEDYGLGKEMKHFYDVSNVSWRTYCQQQIFFPV